MSRYGVNMVAESKVVVGIVPTHLRLLSLEVDFEVRPREII
jgi:hypothetical protein